MGRDTWTALEDQFLLHLAEAHEKNWSSIAAMMDCRTAKQCRERYNNYLKPGLVRGPWSPEEDVLLQELHIQRGNKWTEVGNAGTRGNVVPQHRPAAPRHTARARPPVHSTHHPHAPPSLFLHPPPTPPRLRVSSAVRRMT